MSAGANHTCGVTTDGALWCWGNNQSGQLGTADARGTESPVPVEGSRLGAMVTVSIWKVMSLASVPEEKAIRLVKPTRQVEFQAERVADLPRPPVDCESPISVLRRQLAWA